jgi:23S rRNA pseudouridine1911/1915/1917 synthase
VQSSDLLEIRLAPGERLDAALHRVLARRYPRASRRQVKRALEEGVIRRAAGPEVQAGGETCFEVNWPELEARLAPAPPVPRPEGCGIEVVHEDEHCCVFYKPSGMPSEPIAPGEKDTALNHALAHDPGLKLLHRLDTGTSGLLAFARNEEAYQRLRLAWQQGRVRKFYRARVTTALPPPFPRLIDAPLGHDPKSSRRMIVAKPGRKIRGKPLPARTTLLGCRPLSGLESPTGQAVYEVSIELHTGVMHQIRVHLAWLGSPILGDGVYGGEAAERLWLEAWRLDLPELPPIAMKGVL